MKSLDCLRVVLVVRLRREEAAERALVATAQEITRWKDEREQLGARIADLTVSRTNEVDCVATAGHHQSNEARYRALRQLCVEAEDQLTKLESLRAEQMTAYVEARCTREAVSKLEEQSKLAYEAELAVREQKWNEDMFLASRVSNSNKPMSSEDFLDQKSQHNSSRVSR